MEKAIQNFKMPWIRIKYSSNQRWFEDLYPKHTLKIKG